MIAMIDHEDMVDMTEQGTNAETISTLTEGVLKKEKCVQ